METKQHGSTSYISLITAKISWPTIFSRYDSAPRRCASQPRALTGGGSVRTLLFSLMN
jgi:hypothetical protein